MCLGGGKTEVVQQPTTTTTTNQPWAAQKPYLKEGFQQAKETVLEQPKEYYPGATVVPFSPQTETGLQWQEQRALQGSPVNQAAQQQATQTLQGDFLSAGNPYFSGMADRLDAAIRPKVQSAFEGAGRGRSAGVQEAYTRSMADAMAPLAYQNYADERGRQMSAMQQAPGLAATDYQDIAQLMGAGQTREGLAREYISDDMSRYNYQQQEPSNRLAEYMGLIQGNYGGTGTTQGTTPYYQQSSNPLLMGLGALGAIGSIGSSFKLW